MQPTQDVYNAAQRVVDRVNFQLIRSAMIMSGWTWSGGSSGPAHIPTLVELKERTTERVLEALRSKNPRYCAESGGFRVECIDNHIRVSFVLADSWWYQHHVK